MKTALLAFGTLVNADSFHVGPKHRGTDKNISWNASSVSKNGKETDIRFANVVEEDVKQELPRKYRVMKQMLDSQFTYPYISPEDISTIQDKVTARSRMQARVKHLDDHYGGHPLAKQYAEYMKNEFERFDLQGRLAFKKKREKKSFKASQVTRIVLNVLDDKAKAVANLALKPTRSSKDTEGNVVQVADTDARLVDDRPIDLELIAATQDSYEIVFYKIGGNIFTKKEVPCGTIQFRTVKQTKEASKFLEFICKNGLRHFKKSLHSELENINSTVKRELGYKEQATNILDGMESTDNIIMENGVEKVLRLAKYTYASARENWKYLDRHWANGKPGLRILNKPAPLESAAVAARDESA